jgi:integrase
VTDSTQPRFLTEKEYKLFLKNCEEDIYPIFFTFLSTGLRLGELLHLQWGDIDLKRKKLSIRKKDFWIPKTSEREIPLSEGMMAMLSKIRPSKFDTKDFVFPGKDGKVLRRKLRNDLIRIAEKTGISDFTKVHSLRHTFASHLVMKGVDLPTVQRLLGHASIQTTMIYAHLAPDHLAEAVNKLDLT